MKNIPYQNPFQEMPKIELDPELKEKYIDALLDETKIRNYVLSVENWADSSEDQINLLNELCVIVAAKIEQERFYHPTKPHRIFEYFDEFVESILNDYCEKYGKKKSNFDSPLCWFYD